MKDELLLNQIIEIIREGKLADLMAKDILAKIKPIKDKPPLLNYDEIMDIEEAIEDAVFSGQETVSKPLAIAQAQWKSYIKWYTS